MTEERIKEIADNADMIVRGYAFTKRNGNIAVINLNRPTSAIYMTPDGKMLESTMDEIEQIIVTNIWEQNAQFIEDEVYA